MTSPHWHSLPAQIIARTSSGSLAGNGIARSKCNLAREKTEAGGGSSPLLQPGSLSAHARRDRLKGQNRGFAPCRVPHVWHPTHTAPAQSP